jgi:hypothetical protein
MRLDIATRGCRAACGMPPTPHLKDSDTMIGVKIVRLDGPRASPRTAIRAGDARHPDRQA